MSSDKKLINSLIELYSILQQIKQCNGSVDNPFLNYQIKVTTAKLFSMGIDVEDITL